LVKATKQETGLNHQIPEKPVIYPYVVIRFMSAVYKRVEVEVRQGDPLAAIDYREDSFVQHPQPFAEGGVISDGCQVLLLQGVLEAVQRSRFRMCVVWTARSSTYVEIDGSIKDFEGEPPSGIFIRNIMVKEK
jgi:hypothetical protein